MNQASNMSLLLTRLTAGSLCFRQDNGTSIPMLPVRKKQVTLIRAISAPSSPYLFIDEFPKRETCFEVYDPRKRDRVVKNSVELPDESIRDSEYIGASRGWCALKNIYDDTVHLTNIFNPSISSPKFISLPPLVKDEMPYIQNVSFSCPPDKDGCVMAVKFQGMLLKEVPGMLLKDLHTSLSLCRLGEQEWTHIETPPDFQDSYVMYSERDQMFYVNTLPRSLYSGSSLRDLPKTDFPRICLNTLPRSRYSGPSRCDLAKPGYPSVAYRQVLPLRDMPELMRQEIDECHVEVYMVESPSGEIFTVLEYTGPQIIMVFRRDTENGVEMYTEDIGDLCIFVAQNGSFCVRASMYPGLIPNSVYSAQTSSVFVYHLASGAMHDLVDFSNCICGDLYWLDPLEQ